MIIGDLDTRVVSIDGGVLDPEPSQKLYNHSPDGFSWGYGGSGPSQLALALLLHFASQEYALRHYQDFKFDVLAALDINKTLELPDEVVETWIKEHK